MVGTIKQQFGVEPDASRSPSGAGYLPWSPVWWCSRGGRCEHLPDHGREDRYFENYDDTV
ncbi:MAG: hypothetical protein R2789_15800 [Microthrixaceae bacterium]